MKIPKKKYKFADFLETVVPLLYRPKSTWIGWFGQKIALELLYPLQWSCTKIIYVKSLPKFSVFVYFLEEFLSLLTLKKQFQESEEDVQHDVDMRQKIHKKNSQTREKGKTFISLKIKQAFNSRQSLSLLSIIYFSTFLSYWACDHLKRGWENTRLTPYKDRRSRIRQIVKNSMTIWHQVFYQIFNMRSFRLFPLYLWQKNKMPYKLYNVHHIILSWVMSFWNCKMR